MQYLIIHREERYYTDWYSYENNYIKGMIVIDLMNDKMAVQRLREAAEKVRQAVDPVSDFRGSAAYKKEMAVVFVRRALEMALDNLPKKSKARRSPKASRRRNK